MKTESTIELVKSQEEEYCLGCIFEKVCNYPPCNIMSEFIESLGLVDCGDLDGYVYKVKGEKENE